MYLIVRVIFFIRCFRKSVKLVIFFYTEWKQNGRAFRAGGEHKIKGYETEEIVSGNSFVGRNGASKFRKKFFVL
jgi:hypothetical protein